MTLERFTVDAKLLRELGERLVGRPHIALAELIKNAYDADARSVQIRFSPNRIEILDDGHGMSRRDFTSRWMRIGTVYKQRHRFSPELERPYTGSKGVGRLAAQLLARRLTINTVALRDPTLSGVEARRRADRGDLHDEVRTTINWDDAIEQDQLTQIEIDVTTTKPKTKFAADSACGTLIVLEGLTTRWNATRFRRLAQEIWALQPPFQVDADSDEAFQVTLDSRYGSVVDEFSRQMHAVLDIWTAKVTAELIDFDPDAPLSFELTGDVDKSDDADMDSDLEAATADAGRDEVDGDGTTTYYPDRMLRLAVELRNHDVRTFMIKVPECRLTELHYELRVFDLANRQPNNVRVGDAREYLRRFGGVSVFDAGFRLPYYGADMDWLAIMRDHARRLSSSNLVPKTLGVHNGLQDLPTNLRIFGSAFISTALEAGRASDAGWPSQDALAIQVTRDRLVENASYQQLRNLARLGMDMYAMEVARAKTHRASGRRAEAAPTRKFKEALDLVERAKPHLPAATFSALKETLTEAVRDTESLEESTQAHAGLLGALATAGMTSMAYDHETSKQLAVIRGVATRLKKLAASADEPVASALLKEAEILRNWASRANRLRQLFRPLMDEEARESVAQFSARRVVDDVVDQLAVLARGAKVDASGVPHDLHLPLAGYAAWSAIFQNLLVNAFNATLDLEDRRVDIDGGSVGAEDWLRIQDTGVGIDLARAERLFEPFERGMVLDKRRAALGLGGSGLGLAIVRMIANEVGIRVTFEPPDAEHKTAVVLRWKEPAR